MYYLVQHGMLEGPAIPDKIRAIVRLDCDLSPSDFYVDRLCTISTLSLIWFCIRENLRGPPLSGLRVESWA